MALVLPISSCVSKGMGELMRYMDELILIPLRMYLLQSLLAAHPLFITACRWI
jgi:hypothetical protein